MFRSTVRTGTTTAALSLVVAVAAACGTATTAEPVGSPVPANRTDAESPDRVAEDERCPTSGLSVEVGSGNNDMQGAHLPLRFTNTTDRPCTLHGAPGVSYVTAEGGEQIGLPATRRVDGPVVTLAPGVTASAGLFVSSAPRKTPDCDQVRTGGLRVYPPNGTESRFVSYDGTACAPPLDGPFLEVGPVRPGPDNTRT